MQRILGDNGVGRFSVEFEVANNDDMAAARRGDLDADKVRRLKIQGLVDPGASHLVLPEAVAKKLGLESPNKVKVRYANNHMAMRSQAEGVYLEILGRHSVFRATLEPKRSSALIGAIVLEDLDFLVDCKKCRLVPRDPNFVISEEE